MNPTDPAFPESDPMAGADFYAKPGMDLRTYMATAFLAAMASRVEFLDGCIHPGITDENMRIDVNNAVTYADALIERLNAK